MNRIGWIAVAVFALLALPPAGTAATIGDDGLHKQDWWPITFKDVAEDIQSAIDAGKHLVIVFEQRGCIYCQKMHEEHFADPEIADFVREHFYIVQYNLFGDEEVTDLDGTSLTEKSAARRWGVVFTPTIVFLPDTLPEDGTAADAAVAVMPGAFEKWTFLNMFRWVHEKGYETDEHFQKYHARMLEEARAEGRL